MISAEQTSGRSAQVIELMAGFKKVYEAADLEGKIRALNVVLDKVTLKGDETWFSWAPPFDQLFFINQERKGRLVEAYLTLVRHVSMRPVMTTLRAGGAGVDVDSLLERTYTSWLKREG